MDDIQLTIFPAAHPSRYGSGLCIQYATTPSPFGDCFIAVSEAGICYLGFPLASQSQTLTDLLQREWPEADMEENQAVIKELARKIFKSDKKQPLKIVLKGTDFQLAVWKALLAIPKGSVSNYTDIAQKVKKPKAVRAVGTAIGKNPVSYLVPCHRVVPKTAPKTATKIEPKSGGVGKYLWGSECKAKILESEKVSLPVKVKK